MSNFNRKWNFRDMQKKCENVNIWSVWKNQCILFMRNSTFFDLVRYIMVFNRILCQSSETSRIDVYIIVKDEEFQQCDKPSQYWIIKWKKIHWFITKNIFPKNTILHNYATIHIAICYSDDTRSAKMDSMWPLSCFHSKLNCSLKKMPWYCFYKWSREIRRGYFTFA